MNPAYERIYHFHVRKTAGSSLNAAFLALGGLDEMSLQTETAGGTVEGNGLKFVRQDRRLIEAGDYFFATTHIPAYLLRLPPDTFKITILRDPVARVISYYRYLLWVRDDPQAHLYEPFAQAVRDEARFLDGGPRYSFAQLSPQLIRTESAIKALGIRQFAARLSRLRRVGSFEDLLARIPPRRLLTQLYMFSKRMNPREAADNVLKCDAVCFTETFSDDLRQVATTLGLDLSEKRERRFGEGIVLTDRDHDLLRDRLAGEYEMMDLIRNGLRTRSQPVLGG